MNKEEALKKIEELKNFIREDGKNDWVKIDYSVIPEELFKKYGVQPFEIQKRKMRNEKGEVWNNINYFDALKECEKLGCRLPNVREMLMLLEQYNNVNKEVSYYDKEFLGITELSHKEDVCYEWIFGLDRVACLRGGYWDITSGAGVFTLDLDNSPTVTCTSVGFRCVR